MFKKVLFAALIASSFGFAGCASSGSSAGAAATDGAGAADTFGKPIYLRGEISDPMWNPMENLLIKPVNENVWKATAELKVDYAPYKYKFADASWTPGTNFGYASESAPGTYTVGGEPIVLNPNSKFEEVKVTPEVDGMYDFYIEKQGDKYITYVKPAE